MKKILILFGGNSYEHLVSCKSAKTIMENIDKKKYDVTLVGITKSNTWYIYNDLLKYLDNELPAIDILIRTGGEHRLSNFMLYQMTYAEIFFIDTLFPDLKTKEIDDIIKTFLHTDRRFGGLNEKKTNN